MTLAHNWQSYGLSVVLCVSIALIFIAVHKLRQMRTSETSETYPKNLILLIYLLVIVFTYFLIVTLTQAHQPIHYAIAATAFISAILIKGIANSQHNLSVNLSKAEALENYYATHDDLTGLPNLNYFNQQLESVLENAKQNKFEVALLLIDLNRFKLINETLGHFVGDVILQEIAHRIRTSLRKSDLIARLGGDEFAVLINPVVAQGHLHTISKNISQSVQEPLAIEGKPTDVGVSIGVATYPEHANNSLTLFEKARSAMIAAEKQGVSVVLYDPDTSDNYAEDIHIIGMLQRAIQEEQLIVLYQPQVRLIDEKVISTEALIRWQHPHYGLLDPGRFIPYAEKAGLIHEINFWLLKNVSNLLNRWHEKNLQIPIAINITANGFLNKAFQQQLTSMIKKHPWMPSQLKIELTETSSIDNLPEINAAMTSYKHQGFVFSLDDYGTKHASLEYLKKLPFDELKIDQSFMFNAAMDEDSRAIIRHASEIAQQLKLTTTAEGIESLEVLNIAKDYGINNGQGYYFNEALAAHELEEMLLNLKS